MSIQLEELLWGAFQQGFQLEQQIHNLQQQQALETTVQIINQQVAVLQNDFALLAQSQGAQIVNILDELNAIRGQLASLSNQTGIPQQTGRPVTLPAIPPAGYGGASSSDVATAVWSQPLPNATPFTALNSVDSMQGLAYFMSNLGHHDSIQDQPGYAMSGHWSEPATRFSGPTAAFLDFSTILPTDASIFAWAQRVYPTVPWHAGLENTAFEIDTLNGAIRWWVDLTPTEFRQLQATGGAVTRVPPVWPGIAHVTLGASHALVDGLTIAGPMDGVIVTITSVLPPTGFYPFATRRSYVHVGGVIFVDDNGEAEHSQSIGLDDQVLVPATMQSAASAIFRVKTGTTGTARSWTAI